MKNAIFKLFKVTFPFALAFMMCLPFSMTLNAASVKNIPVKKTLFADVRMTIFIPLLPDMLKCQIKMNFFS